MRWLPGSLATPTRQPLGGARVRADLRAGLLFCYSGATDTIIDGELRDLTGSVPRTVTASGSAIQCSGTTVSRSINGSAAGFASTSVTILVVGQRRDASGITTLMVKGGGSTGFEIALSNQFGSPTTRIYSSHRNTGGTQVNFATGFVDGRADSLNGSFDTVTGRVYAIAASTDVMTQNTVSDIRLGTSGSFGANVDVMFGAVWVGRSFAADQVRSFSVNPWQIIEQTARPLWAPATVTGGGVTITVQDATHAQAAGNLGFTLSTSLAVAAATHAHTAANLTLTAQWLLTVAAAVHAQAADNLTLTVGGSPTLGTADAQHAHAADNLALSLAIFLALQDASHAHAASNVALVVADANADLALAIKIIKNRKQLNPTTGLYTVFDDDGITPLLQAAAWVDPAGTIPYSGGLVQRVDRLEPI
jgi:hypothetical protein